MSILKSVFASVIGDRRDCAEEDLGVYLEAFGCGLNDLTTFRQAWRKAELNCGSTAHPQTFSDELIRQLQLSLAVDMRGITSPELSGLMASHHLSEIQYSLSRKERRAGLVIDYSHKHRGMRISWTTRDAAVLMQPLLVGDAGSSKWMLGHCGPPNSARNAETPDPLVGLRLPASAHSLTAYAWEAYGALTELAAYSGADHSSIAPQPVSATRNEEGELILALRRSSVVPLVEVCSSAFASRLVQSEHLLLLWCAQLRALLAAESHLSMSLRTPRVPTDVFVTNGKLLLANLSFIAWERVTSREGLVLPSLLPAVRLLLASVLGTSRVVMLSAASSPTEYHLMEGNTLTLKLEAGDLTGLTNTSGMREGGLVAEVVEIGGGDPVQIRNGALVIRALSGASPATRSLRLVIGGLSVRVEVFACPRNLPPAVCQLMALLQRDQPLLGPDTLLSAVLLRCPHHSTLDESRAEAEWAGILSVSVR
jgi:hypothetical protein